MQPPADLATLQGAMRSAMVSLGSPMQSKTSTVITEVGCAAEVSACIGGAGWGGAPQACRRGSNQPRIPRPLCRRRWGEAGPAPSRPLPRCRRRCRCCCRCRSPRSPPRRHPAPPRHSDAYRPPRACSEPASARTPGQAQGTRPWRRACVASSAASLPLRAVRVRSTGPLARRVRPAANKGRFHPTRRAMRCGRGCGADAGVAVDLRVVAAGAIGAVLGRALRRNRAIPDLRGFHMRRPYR